MYEVSVKDRFSAAHHLREYNGKCESPHGHNWDVEVSVAGEKLDESGLLMDFHELKDALRAVLEKLDHADLNELDDFASLNPTSENIAKYLYDEISSRLSSELCRVCYVEVNETPGSRARYTGKV